MCDVFVTLLASGGCIVNITGTLGTVDQVSAHYRTILADPSCTVDTVSDIMNKFVAAAQWDQHCQAGFSNSALAMSTLGRNVMGRAHARELSQRQVRVRL